MDDPDVIYFDSVSCNLGTQIGLPPFATYNQSRTIPYLKNPEEYYGAIVSVYLNDTSIPAIVPEIAPYQNDPNLTIYNVSLQYGATIVTQPVLFQPQNLNAEVPLGPSSYPNGIPNNQNGYYNIYSYQFFMGLVNTAFATAYNALNVLVPALPANKPPILVYDSTSSLFSIVATSSLYNDDGSPVIPIIIYMNSPLYHLFQFTKYFIEVAGSNEHQIIMNSNTSFIDTTNDRMINTQQSKSITLWNTITDIVITSTYIPSLRVQTGIPQIQYNSENYPVSTNNSSTLQILVDFQYNVTTDQLCIKYIPQGQYQLFEMNSAEPLYNLDWTMWYKARTGLLYPIFLNSGSTASVKIGFFKKSVFRNLKALM
jgi:hypothetical protein